MRRLARRLGVGRGRTDGSAAVTDADATIRYPLARSVVHVTGSVTVATDPTKKESRARTSEVALAVAADPAHELQVDVPNWKEDRKLDLKLAADGRLTGLSGTSAGVGSTVVAAGVRLAGIGIGAAVAVLGALSESTKAQDPYEAAYSTAYAELSDYRNKLAQRTKQLEAALADVAERVATANPNERHAARVELEDLRGALALVRAETAQLDDHFAAWRNTNFPTRSEEYAFTLGIDELVRVPVDRAGSELTLQSSELAGAGAARALLATLQVLVIVVVSEGSEPAPVAVPDRAKPGVYFRRGRPAMLAVYELSGDYDPAAPTYDLRLKQRLPVSILDSRSKLGYLGVDVGLFGKRGTVLEMDASGAVTRVSTDEASAAGAMAAAAAQAPAQLVDALDQATKITGSLGTLRATAAQRRLDDLQREKKTIEAEIALKGDVASQDQQVQLAKIKAEADTLHLIKQLGGDLDTVAAADKARGGTAESAAETRLG
jgi:hypothetical protein